ncbi:MAG: hypothetical protein V7L11_18880 [Nostoc sp.]|uniref:hypothetical protein n=1 Tax=Nostoc sp. TaxID=1180 RepID=UPI002FFB711B
MLRNLSDRYSGSHSDEAQYYTARCRGTAVPCPYGCTLLKTFSAIAMHKKPMLYSIRYRPNYKIAIAA